MTDLAELRELCQRFLDDRRPIELLDADDEARRSLWDELTAMGWPATLVPEAAGGMGWGWREAAVVAEALGGTLAPVPFLSSALVAVSGLRRLTHADAAATMAEIAAHGMRVAVAGLPSQQWPGDAVAVDAYDHLGGSSSFVLDAAGADRLLVVARRDDTPVLALTDGNTGVDVRPHELFDASRTAAALSFSGTNATVLADGDDASAAIAAMETALAVGLACDALGGAAHVHTQAVDYARTRIQFDRPIGSFQAVKHRLADLYVLLAGTTAIVDAAVERLDGDGPAGTIDSLAHAYAADAYARIAGDAILVHGAIGFTWEHTLHRYLKRAMLNQHLAGTVRGHRDRHLSAKVAEIGGVR